MSRDPCRNDWLVVSGYKPQEVIANFKGRNFNDMSEEQKWSGETRRDEDKALSLSHSPITLRKVVLVGLPTSRSPVIRVDVLPFHIRLSKSMSYTIDHLSSHPQCIISADSRTFNFGIP
jgi:hypothetical protein